MSLTIEELIHNTKKLVTKLKDDEAKADTLIIRAKNMHSQMEAMKQYSEDVEKLNEAASQRPHSVLVAGLQRESQHLRELQAENNELRSALGDHQNVIELIMSKYRQQISQLMIKNKNETSTCYNPGQCIKVVMNQGNEINRMREIMREVAALDEESTIKDQELISRLLTENKGLKEQLSIYRKYGNYLSSENEEEQAKNSTPVKQQAEEPKS